MTIQELEKKYEKIPLEIKKTCRWVGYKVEDRDGKLTKVPYNAITGKCARSNDPNTWTLDNGSASGQSNGGSMGQKTTMFGLLYAVENWSFRGVRDVWIYGL